MIGGSERESDAEGLAGVPVSGPDLTPSIFSSLSLGLVQAPAVRGMTLCGPNARCVLWA